MNKSTVIVSMGVSERNKCRQKLTSLATLYVFLLGIIVFPGLAASQQIITDGKTATSVVVNGKITDITSDTIAGQNAYNSFSKFNVEQAKIVNLHLPANTSNLLNLVHSEISLIDGKLNSILNNGSIGGNVYFANPHGFILGRSGVINVGSLTAITPTKGFVDDFFNTTSVSTDKLLNRTAPINDQGVISIQGRVNALEGIYLKSGGMISSGQLLTGALFEGNGVGYQDVVNVNGIESGSAIVAHADGTIEIVAANTVEISSEAGTDLPADTAAASVLISGADITANSISIISEAGSVQIKGGVNVLADTIRISADRHVSIGDTDGFLSIAGEIKGHWQNVISDAFNSSQDYATNSSPESLIDTSFAASPSVLAGNSVFIAGEYLNINGIVQSGVEDKYVYITPAAIQAADNFLAGWTPGSNPRYEIPLSAYQVVGSEDMNNMALFFDAENQWFELGPGEIMGGYMELVGNIMNTSVGGLRILDGYGRVTVDNPSLYPVLLRSIQTGSGMEGTLKITDLARRTDYNDPLTTVVKRLGENIYEYNNNNIDAFLDLVNPVKTTLSSNHIEYRPRENQYYSWTVREQSTWTEQKEKIRGDWFDSTTSYTHIGPAQIRADTLRVVDNHSETFWYDRSYNLDYTDWTLLHIKDHKWYTRGATETILHSYNIAAFNPIDINFMGYPTGLVDVTSRGDIIVDGPIKNLSGEINLTTDGMILQGTDEFAGTTGNRINLTAGTGIGIDDLDTDRQEPAIKISLVNGGWLNAETEQGDLIISSTSGNIVYDQISSGSGDVNVVADMDIVGRLSDSLISGRRISLTAQHGGIGPDDTVRIDSASDARGGLVAFSAGDMDITEIGGDMDVVYVTSQGGDVGLRALDGTIKLGEINAVSGTVTLEAGDSIQDATANDVANINAIDLWLSALSGSIGAADNHLEIDSSISSQGIVNAKAAHGIYLTEVAGDLHLDGALSDTGSMALKVVNGGAGWNEVSADGDVDVSTAGDLVAGRTESRSGMITMSSSQGGGSFNEVLASLDVALEVQNDLQAGTIVSENGSADIASILGNVEINHISAPQEVNLFAGGDSMIIHEADPTFLELEVAGDGGQLRVDSAQVSESVTIQADNADVSVTQLPAEGPIQFNASGAGGGIADTINVDTSSGNGVVFNGLKTHYTHIVTDAALLDIKQGQVVNRGEFFNRYNGVLLENDNVNQQLGDSFDLQIYASETLSLFFKEKNSVDTTAIQLYKKSYMVVNDGLTGKATPQELIDKQEAAFDTLDLGVINSIIEGYSVEPVACDDEDEKCLKLDKGAIENAEDLDLEPALPTVK